MPTSKRAYKQPPISTAALALAVEAVRKGLAVWAAAEEFSVACTTLQRHLGTQEK
jgi:hypothetical protein